MNTKLFCTACLAQSKHFSHNLSVRRQKYQEHVISLLLVFLLFCSLDFLFLDFFCSGASSRGVPVSSFTTLLYLLVS